MTDRLGLVLIILAAALWGTTGTAQALGPDAAAPLGVGLARLLVAGPALILIARPKTMAARTDWRLLLVAGGGMAAYQPLFFSAVELAGVAIGTVVAIGSAPLLAGALSWMLDRERLAVGWLVATALGIGGLVAISVAEAEMGTNASGIFLAIGAGLTFAVYLVTSRRLVLRASPVSSMALIFATATILSLPLLAVVDISWLASPKGLLMTIHLGLVATALAYVLFSIGLRSTNAPTAATAALFEPVTAGLLGVLILGESPRVGAWIGMALLLASMGVLAVTRPLESGQRSALTGDLSV